MIRVEEIVAFIVVDFEVAYKAAVLSFSVFSELKRNDKKEGGS